MYSALKRKGKQTEKRKPAIVENDRKTRIPLAENNLTDKFSLSLCCRQNSGAEASEDPGMEKELMPFTAENLANTNNMCCQQNQETDQRQKTLLASLLLSSWAPLATGFAVIVGRSVTQVADFIRRTMEFLVLLLSWSVFRYLSREKGLTAETKKKWEKIVNLSIAVSLGLSGLIMFFLALFRFQSFRPGGNVLPGLLIAVLGFGVNFWFWQRYSALERAGSSPIIHAQRQLYLAKIFVDLCVVLALGTVAFLPTHNLTRYVDTLGSLAVSLYLLWSPFRISSVKQNEADAPAKE